MSEAATETPLVDLSVPGAAQAFTNAAASWGFVQIVQHGIPLALSNLQVGYKHGTELPMDNLTTLGNKLSKKEFTDRCRYIINMDSTKRIVNEVETEVTFEA